MSSLFFPIFHHEQPPFPLAANATSLNFNDIKDQPLASSLDNHHLISLVVKHKGCRKDGEQRAETANNEYHHRCRRKQPFRCASNPIEEA